MRDHYQRAIERVQKHRKFAGAIAKLIKLSEPQVIEIRERLLGGEKYGEIAKDYHVKPGTIQAIATGRSWRHLGPPIVKDRLRKLTEKHVREIRKRLRAKERKDEIAADYGVSAATIYDIARGKIWKHLGGKVRGHERQRGHNARKLTSEQVKEIRRRYDGGEGSTTIAKDFGVSASTILLVVNFETYLNS